jgi:hypothetical protein
LLRWALQEPVPDDLIPFVDGSFERREFPDDFGADVNAAFDLQTDYWMYLGYLTDSPDLIFWRRTSAGQDVVTLSQQIPPGSRGTFAGPERLDVVVPAAEFFEAIEDLDRRLIAAMEERVVELERTAPPPGVELDVAHLRIEHGQRSRWLQLRLDLPRQVDWARVRAGVAEIMSWPPYEDEGD